MKLLVFIIMLSLQLLGQTSEDYVIENLHTYMRSKPTWNSFSKNTFTAAQNKLIESVINDSTNTFCDEWKVGGHYFKNFHFLDLDGDKDLDLIFQGLECGGFESETVLIYLNIKSHYKKCLYKMGKISELKLNANLIIYEYPCCAMIENTFINYKIQKDSLVEDFGFTFFYSFILDQPSKNPNNILQHHLKKEEIYTLKKDSPINHFPCDSIRNPIFKQKTLLGKLIDDNSVMIYSTFVDSSGVKWLFCKIPKENVIDANKNSKHPFLAWVKSLE